MKHDDDADDGDNVQGTFLNEYALGKNADIFPEGAGRLIKAGTKINFNLHLHSVGQETAATSRSGSNSIPRATRQSGPKPPKRSAIPRSRHPRQHRRRALRAYNTLTNRRVCSPSAAHAQSRKASCMEAIYPADTRSRC